MEDRIFSNARTLVAKPHSCDVERLVSAYNLFKDDDHCSLSAETVDAYLHWLMNNERIKYKFLSLTYKVLTTSQLSYLHSLISRA